MTYAEAMKRAGVEVTSTGKIYCDDISGKTKSGKPFWMYRAGGAYGMKFTLWIDGKVAATACLYRTALRLIKTN